MSERTDGDDFEYLLQVMRRKIRSFDTSKYLKSSKISEELKLKGTDALKHKKLSEALELYNQLDPSSAVASDVKKEVGSVVNDANASSISHINSSGITIRSEAASLIIANRSLTLYQMKRYSECLKEIQLALEFGYPQELKNKLGKRRKACETALLQLRQKEVVGNCDQHKKTGLRIQREDEKKKSRPVGTSAGVVKEVIQEVEEDDAEDAEHHEASERGSTSSSSSGKCKNQSRGTTTSHPESPSSSSVNSIEEKIEKGDSAKGYDDMTHGDDEKENLMMKRREAMRSRRFINHLIQVYSDESKGGGRGIKSTGSIKSGDILMIEKAYSSVLVSSFYPLFCYNCLKRIGSDVHHSSCHTTNTTTHQDDSSSPPNGSTLPIPCIKCIQVIFCCVSCRNEAWNEFHAKECCFLDLIEQMDSSLFSPSMALRVLLTEGLDQILLQESSTTTTTSSDITSCYSSDSSSHTPQQSSSSKEKEVDKNSNLRFLEKYEGLKSLVSHPDEDKNNYMKIGTFLVAFYLEATHGCTLSSPNTSCTSPSSSIMPHQVSEVISCGYSRSQLMSARDILMDHIRRFQVNSMHMTYREILIDPIFRLPQLEERKIGCGLFLSLSYTNHSCDPNARAAYFDGDRVVVVAVKDIQKDDEILISYGMFYKWHKLIYRQQQLKESYFFDCKCCACLSKLEPAVNAFKCPKCKGPLEETDMIVMTSDDSSTSSAEGSPDQTSSGNIIGSLLSSSTASASEVTKEKKHEQIMSCLKCKRKFQMDLKKLSSEYDTGCHLMSLGIEYLKGENIDGHRLLTSEKLLQEGYKKLSVILYKNHMQLSIGLDYLSFCHKRMARFQESVKYSRKSMQITSEDFNEDVYLFNSIYRLIDCYRFLLIQSNKNLFIHSSKSSGGTRRKKSSSSGSVSSFSSTSSSSVKKKQKKKSSQNRYGKHQDDDADADHDSNGKIRGNLLKASGDVIHDQDVEADASDDEDINVDVEKSQMMMKIYSKEVNEILSLFESQLNHLLPVGTREFNYYSNQIKLMKQLLNQTTPTIR